MHIHFLLLVLLDLFSVKYGIGSRTPKLIEILPLAMGEVFRVSTFYLTLDKIKPEGLASIPKTGRMRT